MKLPTPRKRGDAYRIEIMIDGKRMSATRDTIKECHAWASRKLLESKAGQLSTADTRSPLTLGELMTIQYESARFSNFIIGIYLVFAIKPPPNAKIFWYFGIVIKCGYYTN